MLPYGARQNLFPLGRGKIEMGVPLLRARRVVHPHPDPPPEGEGIYGAAPRYPMDGRAASPSASRM